MRKAACTIGHEVGMKRCTRRKRQYMAAVVANAGPIIQDKTSLHVLGCQFRRVRMRVGQGLQALHDELSSLKHHLRPPISTTIISVAKRLLIVSVLAVQPPDGCCKQETALKNEYSFGYVRFRENRFRTKSALVRKLTKNQCLLLMTFYQQKKTAAIVVIPCPRELGCPFPVHTCMHA